MGPTPQTTFEIPPIEERRIRKKPVEVTAVRFTSWDQARKLGLRPTSKLGIYEVFNESHDDWNQLECGDWIITGVNGERYPISDDILRRTYDFI